jgi:hypothetical protein
VGLVEIDHLHAEVAGTALRLFRPTGKENASVEQQAAPENPPLPQWRPLTSRQRRVAGVLVEKAKTTPDAYPMTLNALVAGCNQKSNRDPQMNLTAEEAEELLDQLRGMGAVAEVHGSGRVAKYRHLLYEWLGVDKHEIAVMAELLLRGEQTVGELRGRAARMEPIADLHELRPIVDALIAKRLVISLTPECRGQVVSHNLYSEKELEQLKLRFRDGAPTADSHVEPARRAPAAGIASGVAEELRAEIAELRAELRTLQEQMRELRGA